MTLTVSILPLMISVFPMAGALAVVLAARFSEALRNAAAAVVSATTVGMAVMLFAMVQQNGVVEFALPWFLGFGLTFTVDFIGALFGLIVTIVWLLSTLFAWEYMGHEHARTRFFGFFTFTLGATAGVFMAGDLFSLFLFFELMTFSAYVLVIHEESRSALRAGAVYLYMSVFGGLALLAAVFLLQHNVGATRFVPALEAIIAGGLNPWTVLILVIFGFGVKAGMLPLHIWLPKAHPVAPSPASALLSALMIKAGAYGFIRFLFTILTPLEQSELWIYPQHFGYLFLWIGAATMLIGGLMALLNQQFKRILAYSSISQMGYILFAVGAGTMLGTRGAFGFSGAWMHIINHAFYKSMLFLMAGAVLLQTHQLDLSKLGGLRKRMPWAFFFTLVAAAGITAVPGFNGYVSKILIHEAILEAYHLRHWPSLLWLERIFVVTGGLTAGYITKLWWGVFGGKLQPENQQVNDISIGHRIVFGIYTVVLLGIGLFAQPRVNQLVLPAAAGFPFDAYDIHHLEEVPFWVASELAGPIKSYVIGLAVLVVLFRFGRHIKIPRWLSVEYLLYTPLIAALRWLFEWMGSLHAPNWQALENRGSLMKALAKLLPKWRGRTLEEWAERLSFVQRRRAAERDEEKKRREFVERVRRERGLAEQEADEREDAYWNTANLGFDSLILALIIAVALLVFLSIAL